MIGHERRHAGTIRSKCLCGALYAAAAAGNPGFDVVLISKRAG